MASKLLNAGQAQMMSDLQREDWDFKDLCRYAPDIDFSELPEWRVKNMVERLFKVAHRLQRVLDFDDKPKRIHHPFRHCAEETLRAMTDAPGGISSFMLAPRVFTCQRKMSNTDPVFQPTLRWLKAHGYVECRNKSTWHLTEKGQQYVAAYPVAS